MKNCKTKILLFGRTGSGKSTIANIMIKGNLDNPLLFETSSWIQRKTIFFQKEKNEKYMVVDTVGFGETKQGTVNNLEARNRLYKFFTKINETGYNYFAYVHKWGKINEIDIHLWSFFKKAFEGVDQNFVILFTHCKHSTLQENLEDVKASFDGCSRYIAIDFPPCSNKHEGANLAKVR
jgi:GTP-binding protein EngB required for normal cell division